MIETTGDIFDYVIDEDTDAICIFTNGITNKYGQAIAGAGQAGAAANRWWNFRYNLGGHLQDNGNVVGLIGKVEFFKDGHGDIKESTMLGAKGKVNIVSFPTKEHFNKPSIPELIIKSARDLVTLADMHNFKKVIMGRPGCGKHTGTLNWDQVKPLIEKILDDRFVIVNKKE